MPTTKSCHLLGGPPAWLAQAILALMAMAALLYKRHKEKPQRPLEVWLYDVSKQVLSMLLAHTCGLLIASIISEVGHRMVSDCAWYFVAFMLDTSVGVALTIGLHSLVLRAARKRAETNSFAATIFNCGNYGMPPQWRFFWPQALEWISVTIIARLMCGFLVFVSRGALIHIARMLDVIFKGHPLAMLYFVMICCPLLMNILQAVLQDVALKWRGSHSSATTQDPGEAGRSWELSDRPLLTLPEKSDVQTLSPGKGTVAVSTV